MNLYKIYLRLKGKLTNVHEHGATSLEAIARAYKSIPGAEFVEIKRILRIKNTIPPQICPVCGDENCHSKDGGMTNVR